ncbi:Ada metal-binding domain-containing protein [Rapidithrix thailandica]|uniref:Ada metal-binding domain-containing protein n=1 Tax=Rapidithrix thailandica TaxID=413964 RepID=A0AAW9SLI0_9BACT
MIYHKEIHSFDLLMKIKHQELCYGGNQKLKIYGSLHCKSGKRMRRETRVFFASEAEALEEGYRPCGHCMSEKYKQWKTKNNR